MRQAAGGPMALLDNCTLGGCMQPPHRPLPGAQGPKLGRQGRGEVLPVHR